MCAYLATATGFSVESIRDMDLDDLARWASEISDLRKSEQQASKGH